MKEKLKPCPFCGGKARTRHLYLADEPTHTKVECSTCHIGTDYYLYEYNDRRVAKVWNTRVKD